MAKAHPGNTKGGAHIFKGKASVEMDDGTELTLFGCVKDGCGNRRILKTGNAKSGKTGKK